MSGRYSTCTETAQAFPRSPPPLRGRAWPPRWEGPSGYPHTITTMLKNEKYIGDVRMQTVDHLSHRRVKNRDLVVPQYYIHDHHPPIVDRETFAIVQRVAVLSDPHRGSTQYPYYAFWNVHIAARG